MAFNFVAKLAKLADPTFIGTPAVRNGLQDCNFEFRRLKNTNLSTLCRNLIRFYSVTLKFTRLECVQQASIITGISFTAFSRGQHCSELRRSVVGFVSLHFTRGDTARRGWLHATLCHAFLVLLPHYAL